MALREAGMIGPFAPPRRLGQAAQGHGGLKAKIFDWFFTTKPPGEGTGLGLAVSREILQAHGGNLRLEDTPGGGATFVLDIPRERPLS